MEQTVLVKILDSVSPDVTGDGQMSEGACVIISSSTKCVEQTASVDIQDLISPNTKPNPNPTSRFTRALKIAAMISYTSSTSYSICTQTEAACV